MNSLKVPFISELANSEKEVLLKDILSEKGSRGQIDCVNWPSVAEYKPIATFSIGHDRRNLYILFKNKGLGLRAVNHSNQSPVSQDSCVEFFVRPDLKSERYWNFEFNAIGAVNASNRVTRPEPTRLTDAEISQIRRCPSVGKEPFEEKFGEFEWELLVIIPLSLMNITMGTEPIKMSGNFLKCGSATANPHYLSWSPINTEKPDFHRTDFFGEIVLEK